VFDAADSSQDMVWKFDIPSAERDSILNRLNEHNLNAFSLFDSEDALMETMWFRAGKQLKNYQPASPTITVTENLDVSAD